MAVIDPHFEALPAARRPDRLFWSTVDAVLVSLVLMLSADMLVQLRGMQSPLWLLCYGLTLLRIAVVWRQFLPVLQRNRVVLLYPAICLASVTWSVSPAYSLAGGLQLAITMVIGLFLGWRYSMALLLKILAVVLSIGVGLSILHWATGAFPWPVYTRVGGLAGLFSSKNMLGLRSLFTLIALLAILLMQRDQAGPLFRLLSVLALLGCLFALALSLSMTSVLLAPVMVAVLVALCWHRIPPALAVAGLMIAIAGAALGPLALTLAGINPIEAVLGAVGKSPTLTGRVYLWQVALEVYRDNPLAGVGYRAFWQAPHFLNERLATEHAGATTSRSFHSFPLEILTSAGWPALFAMLALIWVSTTRMLRVYWHSRSVAMAGGLSLMVGIVVSSLLGTTLYRGHEIMIILVVAFAVSAGEDLRRLDVRQAGGTEGSA